MKTIDTLRTCISTCIAVLLMSFSLNAQTDFTEFSGKVIDSKSKKAIETANLNVNETNISVITNTEGTFILKVPNSLLDATVSINALGYNTRVLKLSEFSKTDFVIKLNLAVTELSQVNISAFKDAEALVRRVFEKQNRSDQNKSVYMTAFYRETIKRRHRNVSLTEAVVNVMKYPNGSSVPDAIKLNKARKSTDYRRLDTVSVKLQGGPFSAIYLDMMKYPEYIFNAQTIPNYRYTFSAPSKISNRDVYVVDFAPKNNALNYNYYGTLYVDVETFALVSANYKLDLSNENKSKNLLVKRKPRSIVVFPLEANYKVDYSVKDGKWYYSYSNLNLRFKVKKKRQLFNKVYSLSSEMAVTDWELNTSERKFKNKEKLRPSVIITDAISGFSDPDFWGEYNLIEPDKSIESAINKIRKSIEKQKQKIKGQNSKP